MGHRHLITRNVNLEMSNYRVTKVLGREWQMDLEEVGHLCSTNLGRLHYWASVVTGQVVKKLWDNFKHITYTVPNAWSASFRLTEEERLSHDVMHYILSRRWQVFPTRCHRRLNLSSAVSECFSYQSSILNEHYQLWSNKNGSFQVLRPLMSGNPVCV